jgi:hypothetical protein
VIDLKHIKALHDRLMRGAVEIVNQEKEEVQPQVFLVLVKDDDTLDIKALPPELVITAHSSIGRKRILQQLIHGFVRTGDNVFAAQINEVWYVVRKDRDDFKDGPPPSECDDRQEAVMVAIHTKEKTYGTYSEIKTVDGERRLEFKDFDPDLPLEGPMTVQGDNRHH